jgi:hypothetical protein
MNGFSPRDEEIWLRMVEVAPEGKNRMEFADRILLGLSLRRAGLEHPSSAKTLAFLSIVQRQIDLFNEQYPVGSVLNVQWGQAQAVRVTIESPAFMALTDNPWRPVLARVRLVGIHSAVSLKDMHIMDDVPGGI